MHPDKSLNYLILILIVSPTFSYVITYIVSAILYFCMIVRYSDVKSDFCVIFIFLAPLSVLLALSIFHIDLIFENEYIRTINTCVYLSFVVMVVDAVKRMSTRASIDFEKYAHLGIRLIAIVLIYRLCVIWYDLGMKGLIDTFNFGVRRAPMLELNPNHADDHFLYAVLLLIWMLLNCKNANYVDKAVGYFCILVYSLLFLKSGSIGGGVGLLAGVSVVVFIAFIRYRNFAMTLAGVAALLVICASIMNFHPWLGQRVVAISTISAHFLLSGDSVSAVAMCDPEHPEKGPSIVPPYHLSKTLSYRLLMYRSGVNLWSEAPFIGHGVFKRDADITISSSPVPCLYNYMAHVHNLYLDLLIRGGILLFSLYSLFGIIVIKKLYHDYNFMPLRKFVVFAIFFTYIFVENFFDLTFIFNSVLRANLFGIAGLWAVSRYCKRREGDNELLRGK